MATRLQRLRRGALTETFPFAGPSFRRAAPWLLAGAAFLALVARLHPAVRFAVWGSDSGEYLYLTERLVETGRTTFAYDGWGIAYPYFPGMFVLSGAVSAVLGVDLFLAVQWTTPILASTLAVLVGLLAQRVTSDPRVGVLAAGFVAVSATVVITTSHAMPGTLGQVFLLFILALFADIARDKRHLLVLGIAGVALVLTHHLTTYFAIGILSFIVFYREVTQRASDWPRLVAEVPFIGGLLALAAIWWLGVADPFRDEIVGDALSLNPYLTAFLFLGALAALPWLVKVKRERTDWHLPPRYPSFPRQRWTLLGMAVGLWLVVLFAVTVRLPGSTIQVSPLALLYVVPVLGFLAFLPLGVAVVRFHKNGVLLVGALYAILASLAFAIVTGSRVLFPFRHVDYMAMAMAPLAAIGLLMVYDQTLASRIPAERPNARAFLTTALGILLATSLVLSLPPREVIGGFEEAMTQAELDAVLWVGANPDVIPPNSTFAADHRLSSLLWGLAGVHPTWDYTPETYHAETPQEALDELRAAHVPPRGGLARVDHVILSPEIEEGVTLVQWENSRPMTPAAIAKFEDERYFEKVYDVDGVRIWRVLWGPGQGAS